ncbi:MAG TPA: hypothetical protein VFZ65_05875 [Planctomycetota bacterium]|nr:hypothetical protein [Planctomycetota bacterium]
MRTAALLGTLFTAPAFAQATLVVDSLGGPGVFTTLQAAVQAASPGDLVLVVPTGDYDFALTVDKGLAIVGSGPGPTVFHGTLHVFGLPANQRCVLRRLSANALLFAQPGTVWIDQCAGDVVLDDVVLGSPTTISAWSPAFAINDSNRVSMHASTCLGNPAAAMSSSRFAASETAFLGTAGSALAAPGPGLNAYGSEVRLSNCSLVGGSASFGLVAGNGLNLGVAFGVSSSAHVSGGSLVGGASPGGQMSAAVLWSGSLLEIDSAVAVGGPIVGPFAVQERGRASLALAPIGQAGSAGFDGPAAAFGVLAASLPAPPVATGFGELWLDPQNLVVLAFGSVPLQVPVTMPSGAATFADVLAVQGLLFHQGNVVLSNPIRSAVR